MNLREVTIQPADPASHFASIADLMTGFDTEPTTAQSLMDWYNRQIDHGIWFNVSITSQGRVLGFNGLYRSTAERESLYGIYLIVDPVFHGCGLGSLLFDHLLCHSLDLHARTLKAWVRDTSDESLRFAVKRGFVEKKHSIEMMFDLSTWDEARYAAIIQGLQAQGFRFTDMAELGDSLEARRKLYALNNSAAATDPGSDGISPWVTFEDFNRSVCQADWYRPDGQIVAIDSMTGEWAAMSAITVFAGSDHAYNLFTGTDVRYRGRKLAQAVKALALRKARTFGVGAVRTSHNSDNAAMIAIDTKLGYIRTPGMFIMEKDLEYV